MSRETILVSLIIGLFIFLSPGSYFMFLVVALFIVIFIRYLKPDEGKFIILLFLAAFILRAVILIIISMALIHSGKILSYDNYPGATPTLIGDSAYYTLRGYWMALDWSGVELSDRVLKEAYNPIYGRHGFTYLIALFNYIFDFSPISSRLINCLFGSLSAVIAFFIMKRLTSLKVAKVAAVLVAFFPSTTLWSVTNLKDTSIIFSSLFIFLFFIKFVEKKKIAYLVCIMLGLLYLSTLRLMVAPIMILTLIITYFIVMPKPKPATKLLVLIVLTVTMLFSIKFNFSKIDTFVRRKICSAISIHQAGTFCEGSNYKILNDKYYLINWNFKYGKDPDSHWYQYQKEDFNYLQYFIVMANGWIHFLFEPFIWNTDTGMKFAAYPQMIIWYILFPLFIFGSIILFRYRFKFQLVLFLYFVFIVSGCALTMSNIGTAFRFRDMVSPIVLMFASVGIAKLFGINIFETNGKNNRS